MGFDFEMHHLSQICNAVGKLKILTQHLVMGPDFIFEHIIYVSFPFLFQGIIFMQFDCLYTTKFSSVVLYSQLLILWSETKLFSCVIVNCRCVMVTWSFYCKISTPRSPWLHGGFLLWKFPNQVPWQCYLNFLHIIFL